MIKPFFKAFTRHLSAIGKVLKNEAEAATMLTNGSDIGSSREKTYAGFLESHCPTNCKVSFGGFVFDQQGNQSKQMDIIITNSKTLQFDWPNRNDKGKVFACIDGCVAVASVKSNLTRSELNNVLDNIASLPSKQPLTGERVPPGAQIISYDDWPYKIVYATTGANIKTMEEALFNYYNQNPNIPECTRPHIIHVLGKYVIIRKPADNMPTTSASEKIYLGHNFYYFPDKHDMVGLAQVIRDIQNFAQGSEAIVYNYNALFNNLISQGVFNGEELVALD